MYKIIIMNRVFKHLTIAKVTNLMVHAFVIGLGTLAFSGIAFIIYGLVSGQITNVHIPCDICY